MCRLCILRCCSFGADLNRRIDYGGGVVAGIVKVCAAACHRVIRL